MRVKTASSVPDCETWSGCAVVIDVLRSSTTVCALLKTGKTDVRLYGAKEKAALYKNSRADIELFSELDFNDRIIKEDNSPRLALKSSPAKPAAVVTTAGTPAVMSLKKARQIFMGGYCNITVLTAYLKNQNEDVLLVPANLFGRPEHLEDNICAESFKSILAAPHAPADVEKDIALIKESRRYADFIKNGPPTAEQDAGYALTKDSLPVLPRAVITGDYASVSAAPAKKAVISFSGGLDSTVCLYWALDKGYECHVLTVAYGQKHIKEIETAKSIALKAGAQMHFAQISLPWLKEASSLTGAAKIPLHDIKNIGREIPSTYVPARNLMFVSLAASLADSIGAKTVILGPNAVDFSGYPDCRPEFYKPLAEAVKKGTRLGENFELLTPIINLNKAEIIKLGRGLGAPLEQTWSCYNGGETPCGECDSCKLREKGFKEAEEL